MNWLPSEKLVFNTTLPRDEISLRLQRSVQPERAFRFGFSNNEGDPRPFEGSASGHRFSIKRVIGYRNSFLPQITGEIYEEGDYTLISVKMSIQILVKVFLILWCGGMFFALIVVLLLSFTSGEFNVFVFFPLGMLLFAYILTMVSFKYESGRAIDDLQKTFEAKIIED